MVARLALLSALAGLAVAAPSAQAGLQDGQRFGFTTSSAVSRSDEFVADFATPEQLALFGRRAGAEVERLTIRWKAVQPRPGTPTDSDWRLFDREATAMFRQGIRPLITITDAPRWASVRPCFGFHCPPDDAHLSAWQVFARRVADRYQGAAAIEIWNSPNRRGWWPAEGGPNARHYARVFNAAARGVREGDPNAKVLFGAVDYVPETIAGEVIATTTFLEAFYGRVDRSLLRLRDGLSIRSYLGAKDIKRIRGKVLDAMKALRGVIRERDPGREIWITETGLSTSGEIAVSQKKQAQGIVTLLDWLDHQPDIATVLVHTLVEPPGDPAIPEEKGYGMMQRLAGGALRPKWAYCALAARGGTPSSVSGCAPLIDRCETKVKKLRRKVRRLKRKAKRLEQDGKDKKARKARKRKRKAKARMKRQVKHCKLIGGL